MYDAKDADNNEGTIRYTIWSDLVKCPVCNEEVSLWDASVGLRPAHIGPDFTCPNCAHLSPVGDVERLTSVSRDDILGHRPGTQNALSSSCLRYHRWEDMVPGGDR